MAKDSKKLVQAITSQEENFAQWYTDICVKAELVEYSSVKGFIILRPYGQAIWELIQKELEAQGEQFNLGEQVRSFPGRTFVEQVQTNRGTYP